VKNDAKEPQANQLEKRSEWEVRLAVASRQPIINEPTMVKTAGSGNRIEPGT
jgi:hypothetical protein